MAIILVRLLSKEQFGSYRQIMLVALFLSQLFGMQLPLSLYYFVPKLGSERRRALLTHTLLLTAVGGSAAAMIMLFGARPLARQFDNPSLTGLLSVFCIFPAVQIVLQIIPHFMISAERAGRGCVYMVVREGVRAGVVVVAATVGAPLGALFLYLLVGTAVLAIVGTADMYRLSPGRRVPVDFALMRHQFVYVLPMAAAAVVGVTNKFFGKFLIGSFFDTEEFAVYAAGAVEIPVYMVVTTSVFAAIMPNLVKLWDQGRKEQMLSLWRQAVRKCSLVIFPVFFALLICARDLMILMYGEPYEEATYPFIIYLLMVPMRVGVYGAFLRAVGRTRPVAVGAVIGLAANVVFSLGILLGARHFFGENGLLAFLAPAIGTALATGCAALYLLWRATGAARSRFAEIMPWGGLGRLFVLGGASGLAAYLVPLDGLPLAPRVLVRAVGCLVIFVAASLATRSLRPDEKELMKLPVRWARQAIYSKKDKGP